MSKRKQRPQGSKSGSSDPLTTVAAARSSSDRRAGDSGSRWPSSAAVRETVESIVIAFIAAFLVRTFEAEAFVIPTGSMAPTLLGRHKDVECPICGYHYTVGASKEVDQRTNRLTNEHVWASTCPMCRYTADLARGNPQHESYPAYSGDRILVGKFAYQIGNPERWDVAVFKYPGHAPTNYIKRLIGLPGEKLAIEHGDVFVQRGNGPPEIARKPPAKLLAMLQPVFDNRHSPPIVARGWPVRWRASLESDRPGAFQAVDPAGCVTFETDGSAPDISWLRYWHLIPTFRDWQLADEHRGQVPPGMTIDPKLIADMTAYNTGESSDRIPPADDALGIHWVGDLAVDTRLEIVGDAGEVVLELIEGGVAHRCTFDVATGRATLSIDDRPAFNPVAATSVRGPGVHDVRLANCDDKLYVWVDGKPIAFDQPTTYQPAAYSGPTDADLAPAAVGSRGVALRVTDLVVRRDLYYIADNHTRNPISDFAAANRSSFDSPVRWGTTHRHGRVEFELGEDQYFMLGDNSARSKDGRLWANERHDYFVRGDALTGKALFIYWPHSRHEIPGTPIPFPFFPNIPRMQFIR